MTTKLTFMYEGFPYTVKPVKCGNGHTVPMLVYLSDGTVLDTVDLDLTGEPIQEIQVVKYTNDIKSLSQIRSMAIALCDFEQMTPEQYEQYIDKGLRNGSDEMYRLFEIERDAGGNDDTGNPSPLGSIREYMEHPVECVGNVPGVALFESLIGIDVISEEDESDGCSLVRQLLMNINQVDAMSLKTQQDVVLWRLQIFDFVVIYYRYLNLIERVVKRYVSV